MPVAPEARPPSDENRLDYVATPTAAGFHTSDAKFRCLMGPVGTGKSVACVMELLLRALNQEPNARRVRESRWLIVRNTYPMLETTTVETFKRWVPPSLCRITYDYPIEGRTHCPHPSGDGTIVDAQFLFMALDRAEDVTKLLSSEYTGFWLNEASEIHQKIYERTFQRLRFPQTVKRNGVQVYGPTWTGVIADTNPPKVGHWLYNEFEVAAPSAGSRLFRYPPAVIFDADTKLWRPNEFADNLDNLRDDYYSEQLARLSEDEIRVFLAGEYGVTRVGKPVHPQYQESIHVAKQRVEPDRGLPVVLAFDWGLNPAMLAGQMSPAGKLVVLDEFSPENESLEVFLDDYVVPLLRNKYYGCRVLAVGDPSGTGRSGLDKRTPFDLLRERGIPCPTDSMVGVTNAFQTRKEAVDSFLQRIGGLELSPHLTILREALAGGYRFAKLSRSAEHREQPEKNEFSHIADALQYLCMYFRRGLQTQRRAANRPAPSPPPSFTWA